ncbi:hypothetical protein J1N35_008382, partial [Gossypium stocksii]
SHKSAGQCRYRNFPYYDQLTSIYAKDQATDKDAQIVTDIVEDIDAEDVVTVDNLEKGNNYRGCEYDISLNEMNVLATQSQLPKPNQDGFIYSKKKKKISDGSEQISTSIIDATMLWGKTYGLLTLN